MQIRVLPNYTLILIILYYMKKKIKSSDLNLSPKPMGASVSGDTGEVGQDTKSIVVRPTDQANCFATFACPSTMDCPITGNGCVTGNACNESGPVCNNTDRCIAFTKNGNECVTFNKECNTGACLETTPDSPCLETQPPVCEEPPVATAACLLSASGCPLETDTCVTPETSNGCEN